MPIRILNAADVRTLLPYHECIPLMRKAFMLVSDGKTEQPIRQSLYTKDRSGLLSVMPGFVSDPPWLGVKVVSVFPENFGSDLGSHQGVVLLFETQTGSPVAMLDGREVTAIRTAAATAAATDALASQDAETLSVFGYGEQAREHVLALCQVRQFSKISVWGRDKIKAKDFARTMSKRVSSDIQSAQTVDEAARADVLCTATSASEPFLFRKHLRPGQHISVVGSSIPTTSEVDVHIVEHSRVFVDFEDSAMALAGDLRLASKAGLFERDDIIGNVGDVIAGRVSARAAADDITLFKSLGMICEDLVACDHIVRRADKENVGQVIGW